MVWLSFAVSVLVILSSVSTLSQLQADTEIILNFNQENKKFELESLKNGYPVSEEILGYTLERTKPSIFKQEKFTIKNKEGNFEVTIKDFESLFKEIKEIAINNDENDQRYLTLKLSRDLKIGFENDEELKIPLTFGQKVEISNPRSDFIDVRFDLPKGKTRTFATPYLITEELSEEEKEKIKFETIPIGSYESFSNTMEDLNKKDIVSLANENTVEKNRKFIIDEEGHSYIRSFGLRLSKKNGNYYFFESTIKITKEIKFKLKEAIRQEIVDDLKFPEGETGALILDENALIPLSIPKKTLLKIKEENRIRNSVIHNQEVNIITEDNNAQEQLKEISENKEQLKPK